MTDLPRPPHGALPLEVAARRTGAYVWLNRRLFETLGGWVATTPHAEAQMIFGQHCYQHVWHAELFEARLPRLREFSVDAFTAAPSRGAEELLDVLQAKTSVEERLVGAYRVVLPRLLAAYVAHLAVAVAITDAPTIRSLSLALNDVEQEWRAGELLLQTLLQTREAVRVCAETGAELETLAIGLFKLPDS